MILKFENCCLGFEFEEIAGNLNKGQHRLWKLIFEKSYVGGFSDLMKYLSLTAIKDSLKVVQYPCSENYEYTLEQMFAKLGFDVVVNPEE